MSNRRLENRLLCAELVEVRYRNAAGFDRRKIGNLEDISLSGACIQIESRIPEGSDVTITYGDGELAGVVRYCVYRDTSYFLGVQFSDNCRWSETHYRPEHLLDPHDLVLDSIARHDAHASQQG